MCTKTNLVSLSLGAILVFSYAPFSLWWLPFLVLPSFFVLVAKLTGNAVTKAFFSFGFGWFAAGISWVHVSIDSFGGLPLPISILLMLLLCGYLALYPALAGFLATKLNRGKISYALLPAAWCLAEFCRATFLTGFPWLSLGYSQIDGPLASLAPIVGEIGITFAMLTISLLIASIATQNNRAKGLMGLASVILILISAAPFLAPKIEVDKTVKVALVQGNIEQALKFNPDHQWPTMIKYMDLTRLHYDADIILWPESAVPSLESLTLTQEFLDMAQRSAMLNNAAIITGIINYDLRKDEYFNSVIVLGKETADATDGEYYYNNRNRYYKNHLLPIGEFVPFQSILRPIAPLFNLPMSSFSRGAYQQKNISAQGIKILPLICFEVAFPYQLSANFTQQTQMLLTVSNDTWFGASHGPHQHLEIARMRALEFARPMLRSTNNGVTAVVDHQGNISAVLPQFEEGVLRAEVTTTKGSTFYSQYALLIHFLLPLLSVLAFSFFRLQKKEETN